MIFVSILVAMTLTTLSASAPLSYSTYQRRGLTDDDRNAYIPYLVDGSEASVNEMYWPQVSEEESIKFINNTANNIRRMKKLRSLSVTNSLDVLRDRVLLELARRKAHQEQRQINENRRILDNIGKRSMNNVAMNIPQNLKIKSERIFGNHPIDNPEENNVQSKGHLNWYNIDDMADLYENNNELQKLETNELGLL